MALVEYIKKRHFGATPEPRGKVSKKHGNSFVVQEHHATRLHYDFRLEIDGTLKSWAVPKGPSLNPADKRLAVQTEDHPLDYAKFEGTIPAGNYGAGEVNVWDEGTFDVEGNLPAREQITKGELKFYLHGQKLRGSFVLVKLRNSREGKDWLLIKHRDDEARDDWNIGEHPESVLSGRTIEPKPKKGTKTALQEAAPNKSVLRGKSKPVPDAELPPDAKRAPMPEWIAPALASLADKPFSDTDWLFEIKWDGLRALSRIEGGKLRLFSRSHREIDKEYPDLARIPECVKGHDVWLDGEIVSLDAEGRSDFQKLQQRFSVLSPGADLIEHAPVVYYVFDLLYCDGYDLRNVPLLDRKEFLRTILQTNSLVRFSDHQIEKGLELYALAKKQSLEGIIAKQARSVYPQGRTKSWLKFKLEKELDAVIAGWTAPRNSREHFGALLVGLYEGRNLEFIAAVGSGFSNQFQARLMEQLKALQVEQCPFHKEPRTREKSWWVKPELVARVKFGNWTDGRHLRQPRFGGLLEDHDPLECTFAKELEREVHVRAPKSSESTKKSEGPSKRGKASAKDRPADRVVNPMPSSNKTISEKELAGELDGGSHEELFATVGGNEVHLTHLNKIYFPEDGYTKRDLLNHYLKMSSMILPFLKDRPLVLRRYPNGIRGEAFFQKDAGKGVPEWIQTAKIQSETRGGTIRYFLANDLASLLYLTNLGCIDHNPWSSRYQTEDFPDYIFFDLDPGADVGFPAVVELASALVEELENLHMKTFIKTSGATGLHIFLPIEPRYTYEQVRQFVQVVAALVAQKLPKLVTTERSLNRRPKGTIYVDAHQNSRGQSLASVYSVRAFPHAPVSTPLSPRELTAKLTPQTWNIKSISKRMEKVGDLWANFWKDPNKIENAIESLEKKLNHPPTKSR